MPIDLEELERLLAEATPGPWTVSECDDLHAAGIHAAEEKYPFGTTSANEEARLIVAAVNALPALISEIRELRADRERLDWLEDVRKSNKFSCATNKFSGKAMYWSATTYGKPIGYGVGDTLRAAIDASRGHAEQGGAE